MDDDFDYHAEEERFDFVNRIIIKSAIVLFLFILAVCVILLLLNNGANGQTIGDTQLGVMQFDVEFSNSYLTDTLVTVGNEIQFNIPAMDYVEFKNPTMTTVELRWPDVEWIIANDIPVSENKLTVKIYPGYNQYVRVNLWNDEITTIKPSREYFIIALREAPDGLNAIKHALITACLGSQWPSKKYDQSCDLNSDGRIDRLDMIIFEQAKYWK